MCLERHVEASPFAPSFLDPAANDEDLIVVLPEQPAPWRRVISMVILVLLAGMVLWGILRALQPPWLVNIVVANGKVLSHRGVAKAHFSTMIRFFEHDVALGGHTTIRAARHPNGALTLKVSGRTDPGTRQQIRNFLITIL